MATVTLPMRMLRDRIVETTPTDFEIDQLSLTRSITRQGKGARAEWRHQFRTLPEIPQSHEAVKWNLDRARRVMSLGQYPKHGIRATHRALQSDPWAIRKRPEPVLFELPGPRMLFGDEQAAPGSDDR